MKLGLIARADPGGLGTQTWEFWRHLQPDVTVVMNMGEWGPGVHHHGWYDHGEIVPNDGTQLSKQNSLQLMSCDVVFSAETFYDDHFWQNAGNRCSTVLQTNPELYRHNVHNRPTLLWLPTPYARERMPVDAQEVPVPVALDRFQFRTRTECTTFVHLTAPAMADRNGTRVVVNALKHMKEDCRLVIRGSQPFRLPVHPHVQVEFDRAPVDSYWEGWRDDYDVLVLPRRYAGLCLPVQEAAAAGIPAIMTDVSPNDFYTHLRVPIQTDPPGAPVAMKGGFYDVAQVDPVQLAILMDRMVASPSEVQEASIRAGLWARAYSWDRWEPTYRQLLDQAAAMVPS